MELCEQELLIKFETIAELRKLDRENQSKALLEGESFLPSLVSRMSMPLRIAIGMILD